MIFFHNRSHNGTAGQEHAEKKSSCVLERPNVNTIANAANQILQLLSPRVGVA